MNASEAKLASAAAVLFVMMEFLPLGPLFPGLF
jgi:hypothetical protein